MFSLLKTLFTFVNHKTHLYCIGNQDQMQFCSQKWIYTHTHTNPNQSSLNVFSPLSYSLKYNLFFYLGTMPGYSAPFASGCVCVCACVCSTFITLNLPVATSSSREVRLLANSLLLAELGLNSGGGRGDERKKRWKGRQKDEVLGKKEAKIRSKNNLGKTQQISSNWIIVEILTSKYDPSLNPSKTVFS